MSSSQTPKLLVLALLSIFMMGFVPVLISWVSANEVTIGIVRLAIAATGILCLLLLTKQFTRITRRDLGWLAILGFTFCIHWYMYFYSIKQAGPSLAAIAVCTFGIHLLFVNRCFFNERFTPMDYVAVVIAISGVVIATPFSADGDNVVWGFTVGVASGFLYACLPAINRQIKHLNTNTRALGQFGFGLIGFLMVWPASDWQLSEDDWIGLVILGVMCTLGAHTLWNKVSTELSTKFTAVIYYLYIPMAMSMSVLLLDQVITWSMIIGASLIVAANVLVVLFHKDKKESAS